MNKKLLYVILGTILVMTFIGQAINKSNLAIFPLIGSVAFFYSAWKHKHKD